MPADAIAAEWDEGGANYRSTIAAGPSSSAWLRDTVLKPIVVRLLGDRSRERVLDVGTGSGWLFDEVSVGEAHACDVSRPERIAPGTRFVLADLAALPHPDAHFDAIVASVVLCYCADLPASARELARVARPGAAAVVALVHPYFYRTGDVGSEDSYRITADLSEPTSFQIRIGGKAGPFTYHLHQPPAYVNAFVRGGWRLTGMEDAFIPRAHYLERLGGKLDDVPRSTKVPLFTFMTFERD